MRDAQAAGLDRRQRLSEPRDQGQARAGPHGRGARHGPEPERGGGGSGATPDLGERLDPRSAEVHRPHPEDRREMKAKRFGIDGKENGTVELPKELFEAEINEHLIWEAVKSYLGNQRQGTAAAKNRAKVSGGGRKPWRQKGTGRARAGSNTSPLWPGGGVAFPPRPRDYTTRLNAKAKLKALCGALTARAKDGGVTILDAPRWTSPKRRRS